VKKILVFKNIETRL